MTSHRRHFADCDDAKVPALEEKSGHADTLLVRGTTYLIIDDGWVLWEGEGYEDAGDRQRARCVG